LGPSLVRRYTNLSLCPHSIIPPLTLVQILADQALHKTDFILEFYNMLQLKALPRVTIYV